jgi:twinkle protein
MRQLACHLIESGKRVMVASLEERADDVFYEHTCVAVGSDTPTEGQLEWAAFHWQDKLRIWSCAEDPQYAEILAAARVVASQDTGKTFHLIIDSLMALDVSERDIDDQKQFVLAMKRTLKWRSNMHIHLVAHPKKPQHADQKPDQNDVAGSASISRLADSIVLMRKPANEEIKALQDINAMSAWICKQRYNKGRQGELTGWFNRRSMQFVETDQHDQPLPGVRRYLPKEAFEDKPNASNASNTSSIADIARGRWSSESPFMDGFQ